MESLSMKLVPVFDWLLTTTLQAVLLLCLILLVQFILRGRLPIRWHYCLWLLLLIRMVSPWLPESRISIFNYVPSSIQHGGIIKAISQPQHARGMGFYSRVAMAEPQETETNTSFIRFTRMIPLLWLLGGAALAVYVAAANFRLWWLVTRERPLTDQKILDLLEDCKAEMEIRNILGVVTTDKVSSAALFGFLRPRLLLPAGMVETLSLKELRYVFLHELGHLRRRDIYIGWLMSLLQVLHWFNPLVWFAFYRMQSDRELACDALVLTYAGGESKDYGRTIVNLLEHFSRTKHLPSMAGISENKSQLKRRIKMIARFKKTSRKSGAGAMLFLAVLACIVLTNAYIAKADFEFGEPVNLTEVIPVINPMYSEAIHCFSYDGLEMYVSGLRPGGFGGPDIWVSRRATTDSDWGPLMNLGPAINTAEDDSYPSISADGLRLYWDSARTGGYGYYDIYMATRATNNDPWGPAVNLGPKLNSASTDASAWESPDGLELYFVSYRSGGYGNSDIYVAKRARANDPWGDPMNLGPVVNSPYSEHWISLSPDGLLLFFCEPIGEPLHPDGYGATDCWMTRRANLSAPWQVPVNLGPRINGPANDINPRVSPDDNTFYFGSVVGLDVSTYHVWKVPIIPIVDFNGDGKIDIADVSIMVENWHTNDPLCDIGPMPWGDGFVDAQDLAVLAEHMSEGSRPIAHWKMDETDGKIAHDSAGYKHGTLNEIPLWRPNEGKFGGALEFHGIDDFVSTPFILDPANGSFSIFAWIKSSTKGQVIISQTGKTGERWLWTDPSYGRLTTWLMHPPFDPLMSGSSVTDGQWHHVGMVYDSIGLKRYLYIDGKEVARDSDFVGGVNSDGGLYFGADKTLQTSSFFSGLIDDIRIYNKVLSAEEVADLAQ